MRYGGQGHHRGLTFSILMRTARLPSQTAHTMSCCIGIMVVRRTNTLTNAHSERSEELWDEGVVQNYWFMLDLNTQLWCSPAKPFQKVFLYEAESWTSFFKQHNPKTLAPSVHFRIFLDTDMVFVKCRSSRLSQKQFGIGWRLRWNQIPS